MKTDRNIKKIISAVVIATQLAACATYQSRSVPFKVPENYANSVNVSDVIMGAEAFADPSTADEVFGFDVRASGLLPVQIVLDNRGNQGVQIITEQSFLVDQSGRYWKTLTTQEAIERLDKATANGVIGKGAGKGALYGAAAGTVLGLALGVVSGHRAGNAALTGGVLGGAGGAIIGGASSADTSDNRRTISEGVREKGINDKTIPPGMLANGFIFFPGEAPNAGAVRLQVLFRNSGVKQTIILPFTPGAAPQIISPVAPRPADG